MFSETRYARNGDLRVAYRASAPGARDIVFVPNWFTCCELFPELPSTQGCFLGEGLCREVWPCAAATDTAVAAAQVGGCNADHHLRLHQPSGRVDECDDFGELFGDGEVGLGGGLNPGDVLIGQAQ